MPGSQLEIACFHAASAQIAEQGGADRIELCDGLEVGGTTPSTDLALAVCARARIPVRVMIRPRGGDFVYSAEEFLLMQQSIRTLKACGIQGFVFGILTPDHRIDRKRNEVLVEMAWPLPCTFHRAFDQVDGLREALEAVIACGFDTILTSGRAASASEGLADLELLLREAAGRIHIMPGGGIRSSNIKALKARLHEGCYHSSAITGPGALADLQEVQALKRQLHA